MTTRVLRVVTVALVVTCLAFASGVVGPALSTDSGTTPDPAVTATRSPGALPAPFAQADDDSDDDGDDGEDEETRVINITAPDEEIEYTLTAPGLEPASDVDIVDGDGNESNQDVIDGDSATGFIGNGNYDAYRFIGSIDQVRLDSNRIDDLEVTIDGEPVDPRTLTGEETETTATTTETTTATTEATTTATQSTGTSAATGTGTAGTGTDASTTTSGPATTTAGSGAASGQSGFGIAMFVLIGVVSGLVLAGALVYVVGSDRFG